MWELSQKLAIEYVRPMRGRSNAHLVRASDDSFAVVKLLGSADLLQEVAGRRLAQFLGAKCAEQAIVTLTDEFVHAARCTKAPEQFSSKFVPGDHFGSVVPVDPRRFAIYDLLPAPILEKVENLGTLAVGFVLGLWLGADTIQSIYYRSEAGRLIAALIDFEESFFERRETTIGTLSRVPAQLSPCSSFWDSASIAAERIMEVSAQTLSQIRIDVPSAWCASSSKKWTDLWDVLDRKRSELVKDVARAKNNSTVEARKTVKKEMRENRFSDAG